jgi:hypothetical protein
MNGWRSHPAPNTRIRLPLRHEVGERARVVLGEQGTKLNSIRKSIPAITLS